MKQFYSFLIASISLSLAANAQPVVSAGTLSGTHNAVVYGQWKGFKNNNNAGIFAGTNLTQSSGYSTYSTSNIYNAPGNNSLTLVYNNTTDVLTTTINSMTTSFTSVSTKIVGAGKTCHLNYLQITIGDDKNNNIFLNDVVVAGNTLGNFQYSGGLDKKWNITNIDLSAGFTLTATLVLASGNYGNGASSFVNIEVGETVAFKTMQMNSACENSPATISLTGLIPEKTYTASYKIGTESPITSSTFTSSATGTGAFNTRSIVAMDIAKTLSIVSVNPGCDWTAPNSGSGTLIVLKNTWLGLVSNDWYNPVNWAFGIMPDTSCTAITIATGGLYQPNLSNVNFQVKDLYIKPGASLKIKDAKLKVTGVINNQGSLDLSEGTLEMNGSSAAQQLSAGMFLNKKIQHLVNSNPKGLTIAGAATDTLKITGSVSFGNVNNAALNTGDHLSLISSINATAWVADITNNGSNTGNKILGKVNVERYISNGGKWRFLSIPTNGNQSFKQAWQENAQTANANPNPGYGLVIGNNTGNYAANGFDVYTPGGPTVKTYNAATGGWDGISNTNNLIASNSGYMTYIRSDRSGALSSTIIRTSGDLKTGTLPAINVPADKYTAVGNPYAAPVDLTKLNMQGLQDMVYVWDPKAGGSYGLGAYQMLFRLGNSFRVFPGGGSYGAGFSLQNTIESGQAFFVKGGSNGGSIQFDEKSKDNGSSMVFKAPEVSSPYLSATLQQVTATASTVLDGAMVNFDSEYSVAVDEDDIIKLINGSENVSFKNGSTLLMADRRSMPVTRDTLQLNFNNVRLQNYKWTFELGNINDPSKIAYLFDKYANTITQLNMNGTTEYAFTMVNIPAAYAPTRFAVVFENSVVLPVTITAVSAQRNAATAVNVKWEVENETNMKGYELQQSSDGSNFKSIGAVNAMAGNTGRAVYYDTDANAGVEVNFYRIKAISTSGQVQYSAIVKVAAVTAQGERAISVYPNPVVNKQMQVKFMNQPAGNYKVQLFNGNGAIVFQKNVKVTSSTEVKSQALGETVAAGHYQLVVTGEDGSSSTQSILVW